MVTSSVSCGKVGWKINGWMELTECQDGQHYARLVDQHGGLEGSSSGIGRRRACWSAELGCAQH